MWIEVFKTGNLTDSSGNAREWTAGDLDKIVASYNSQKDHEAPVVIGHPVDNSPAYGWIESLKRRGDILLAKLGSLAPEFVEWVKKGLYKKRSIALYGNGLLRHIGFLGGTPPAVKGLADPTFSDDGENTEYAFADAAFDDVTITAQNDRARLFGIDPKNNYGAKTKPEKYSELSDSDFADPVHYRFPTSEPHIKASLGAFSRDNIRQKYSERELQIIAARLIDAARRMNINLTPYRWAYSEKIESKNIINNKRRNYMTDQLIAELTTWLADTFGEEVANQTAGKLEELAAKYPAPKSEDKPAEKSAEKPVENSEPNERENIEVAELRKEVAKLRQQARFAEHRQYCEKMIADGKLTPAQIEKALPAIELGHNAGELTFAEKGASVTRNGEDIIKSLIESYDKRVDFSETTGKPAATPAQNYIGELGLDEKNAVVDEGALDLHEKIKQYQEAVKTRGEMISYVDALKIVSGGNA